MTLADYDGPCVPWSHAHPGQPDVWSGFITETEENRPNVSLLPEPSTYCDYPGLILSYLAAIMDIPS